MIPQREILWNIPPGVMMAVYGLSALGAAWIALWFLRRARLWRRGVVVDLPGWGSGLARLAGYLATHRTIRRDPYAGWMHALTFYGFAILLVATTLVGIQHHGGVTFLTGRVYLVFSLGADLGGAAFCAGIGMALWRRRSPKAHGRLQRQPVTTATLWGLMVLGVSGFLVEGARIAQDFPPFEVWSPVGYALAKGMAGAGLGGEALHRALWVGHAALVIVFLAVVPLTVLRHILLAAVSVARPAGRPGVLWTPTAPAVGAADLPAFRQVDLMQADACLTCGLCTTVCPAEAAGKPLSPRAVVLGLRAHLDHPETALHRQVPDEAVWSCTTCHACDAVCPADIRILDKIVTMRRGRVAEGEVPASASAALEAAAQKFNPFDRPNSARMEWAAGLDVPVVKDGEEAELIYWVGCAGAFDPAGREVSRAMVRILNQIQTPYRLLGCGERCTGDPARRLGEEGLWRELAGHNRRTFAAHRVKTILTHCPHCANGFQNEYPALGPMPRVLHHSEWLLEQIAAGAIRLKAGGAERVTFHDPCYLSRAIGETEAPRAVLDGMFDGRRTEMQPHGEKSFCCGGGGGQMWLDVRGETRVETVRAGHAEETGAQVVATGCPFCRVMMEAGRTALPEGQGRWRVQDIAEIVAERMING